MANETYQAQVSTPEEDAILNQLGESLSAWVQTRFAETIIDKKNFRSLMLTSLMLYTASGAASAKIPKHAFIDLMGKYFDMYQDMLNKQS